MSVKWYSVCTARVGRMYWCLCRCRHVEWLQRLMRGSRAAGTKRGEKKGQRTGNVNNKSNFPSSGQNDRLTGLKQRHKMHFRCSNCTYSKLLLHIFTSLQLADMIQPVFCACTSQATRTHILRMEFGKFSECETIYGLWLSVVRFFSFPSLSQSLTEIHFAKHAFYTTHTQNIHAHMPSQDTHVLTENYSAWMYSVWMWRW